MKEVNNFDVLKEMSAQDKKIYFGQTILRFQKTKAGVQVVVGMPLDIIGGLVGEKLGGGLILWDKAQFAELKQELEEKE